VTDAISDVLRSIRLTGGIFLDARFTAPWCVSAAIAAEDCKPLLAAPAQVIAYHYVIAGSMLVLAADEPPLRVDAGEIVLLPRNDDHVLTSETKLNPVSARELIRPSIEGGLARIFHGGGGASTQVVCGFLGSEEIGNPVIATLPKMLKLDVRQGTSRDWIEASLRFAAAELTEGRMGSSGVMSRLSESLFVEAVRNYAATLGDRDPGWLKGARDPQVGRALALIHTDHRTHWSAAALAQSVGMSRSAFVDRFSALVGAPPIRYLTAWRLRLSRSLIRETQKSVAEVAHFAGYGSDEAFSRAFKREFGVSPAQWREQGNG
jgi:AraC-like DNA-binding protein